MTKRRWIWLVVAVVVVVGGIAFWAFAPWTLFVDKQVDEALPSVSAPAPTESPDPTASQKPRPTGPETLANGKFQSYEHETTGSASLIRLANGDVVVRLAPFATSNGPDVRVWLSERKADNAGGANGGKYLDLGALKGNIGNQNYQVPKSANVDEYKSVVIWCRRFSVAFGAASVEQKPQLVLNGN